MNEERETIVAISTSPGEGGIGIVRLSGSRSLTIADRIFKGKNGLKPSKASTHTLHYGCIASNGEVLDEVLLTVMRAPRTYTREDVVEINCHGGIILLKKVMELTLREGARLAQPGEFTKRAFLNGRIDLTQAEAVIEIIRAKTESGLRSALSQLWGEFSKRLKQVSEKLTELLAQVEASIDFPEEDIGTFSADKMAESIAKITSVLEELLATAKQSRLLREGITISLAGRPNVGKSTLLNSLLERERAIVTPLPGTTRDTIEEFLDIDGLPARLIDTAGIRKAKNLIDRESIRRTRLALREADLILFVLDGSTPLSGADTEIAEEVSKKKTLVVINKIDLPMRINKVRIFFSSEDIVSVSAKEGSGISDLKRAIVSLFRGVPSPEPAFLANLRHQTMLEKALRCLENAHSLLTTTAGEIPLELIAFELRDGLRSIGEVTGEVTTDDILNEIFSRFCIGK
ncbi:MAG: tRNA modification GTPase MnmE [Firmicutes bacterium]|nr:tRNA modification GTPase MnmE [Bacillota bacterium]